MLLFIMKLLHHKVDFLSIFLPVFKKSGNNCPHDLFIYLLAHLLIYFCRNSLILVRVVSELETILETHHEPGVYLDRMTLPSQGTFTSGGNLA